MNNRGVHTNWAIRKDKRDNDAIINIRLKPLLNEKKQVSMLSLPGPEWIYEEQLIRNNPDNYFVILGVERSSDNNRRALARADELMSMYSNCKLTVAPEKLDFRAIISRAYNCSTPEFSGRTAWDIIYPDYMGLWTNSAMDDVKIIFNSAGNVLSKLGVFITTFGFRGVGGDAGVWGDAVRFGDMYGKNIQIDDDRLYRRLPDSKKTTTKVHSLAKGIAAYTSKLAEAAGSDLHIYAPHIYYRPDGNPEGSFCYYKK